MTNTTNNQQLLSLEEIYANFRAEEVRIRRDLRDGFGGYDKLQCLKRVLQGVDAHGRTSHMMEEGKNC